MTSQVSFINFMYRLLCWNKNKKSRVKIFLASAVQFLSTETLTYCQSNETDTFSQSLILRNDYKHHDQTRRKPIIKVLTKEMSTQIDRKLSLRLRTSTCGFTKDTKYITFLPFALT